MRLKNLEHLSWLVAGVLVVCAVIDLVGRTVYAGGGTGLYGYIADHPAWTVALLVTAVLLAVSLLVRQFRTATMSLACGCLVVWSMFLILWTTETPPPPVSILGPVLALGHGLLAFMLAHAWADIEV